MTRQARFLSRSGPAPWRRSVVPSGRWNYLDTLALAQHMTGDTAKAIETQRRALGLIPPEYYQQRKEMEDRLAEYEAAPATQPASSGAVALPTEAK